MASLAQTVLDAKLFDQVWSGTDLNLDQLTSEINKIFTYNKTETERHNFSDIYFSYNENQISSSSTSVSAGISITILNVGFGGFGSTGGSSGSSLSTLQTSAGRSSAILTGEIRLYTGEQAPGSN
jgi:hypothetical protein